MATITSSSTTAGDWPWWTSGQTITPETLGNGIEQQIDNSHIIKALVDDVTAIKKALKILDEPSPELLQKYAALKDLYDQYKMIEALINDEEK